MRRTRHLFQKSFSTVPTTKHDICILGCGPAGYAAAIRAKDLGRKPIIIEKAKAGGAGLYDGALSSKSMWEMSEDYKIAQRINAQLCAQKLPELHVSYAKIKEEVNQVLHFKHKQMMQQLQELDIPLIEGEGNFVDNHTIAVKKNGQVLANLQAENVIIATGSSPRKHDSVVMDGKYILSSDHVMQMDDFPESMVILGAGVVGCEYATIFCNYGKTRVHLIDRAPRILPFEDSDIATIISNNFEEKGAVVHRNASLVSMQLVNNKVQYVIEYKTSGKRETVIVDKALLSIGRKPNIHSLQLQNTSVKVKPADGTIITNAHCQTSVPHIYAIGDMSVDVALVNIGEVEGRYAVEHICSKHPSARNDFYKNISMIMFLDPELAGVGMNEIEAQKQKIKYKCAVYGYPLVARAIAMRKTEGLVKLLVSDDDQMRILGIRALGQHSSSLIEVVSLMIRLGRSLKDLEGILTAYPSVAEGLQECVRMLMGSSIYKAHVFEEYSSLYRVSGYDEQGKPIVQQIKN